MRTIQIVNVRWFNATAWYGLWLSKLLREAGHETLVITLPHTDNWEKAIEFGFDPIFLPFNSKNPFNFPKLYYSLRKLVREFRPDIINCHRGEGFIACALLREDLKNFGLIRTRGDQRLPKTNLPNLIMHKHMADAVIATNSRMADFFLDRMGLPTEQVHTILGGVDTAKFRFDPTGRAKVRAEFGLKDTDFVIGLLGRYDEVKGHGDLLEAVARLYKFEHMSDLKIMFIGHPCPHFSEDRLRACAAKAGIADIVRYTGRRTDIAACISALDAGVVASLWSEAIARAALEIMACSRPLISTTVGVMPDLLPGIAMYPPGNIEELARLLLTLHQNELFKRDLLLHQEQRLQQLTPEVFLNSTLTVYEQALAKVRNRA